MTWAPRACVKWTMNIHEHTWTALECRPTSACKSFQHEILTSRICKPEFTMSEKTNHAGVTTMRRLDQGHLHPLLEHPRLICPGRESNQASVVRTLAKSYLNSQLIAIRNIYMSSWQCIKKLFKMKYYFLEKIVILNFNSELNNKKWEKLYAGIWHPYWRCLFWKIKRKVAQIINEGICLPFYLLFILRSNFTPSAIKGIFQRPLCRMPIKYLVWNWPGIVVGHDSIHSCWSCKQKSKVTNCPGESFCTTMIITPLGEKSVKVLPMTADP